MKLHPDPPGAGSAAELGQERIARRVDHAAAAAHDKAADNVAIGL